MLYLPKPTFKELDNYYNSVIVSIKNALKKSPFAKLKKNYIEKKLTEIITEEPSKLILLNGEIESLFIQDFDDVEFKEYLSIKNIDDKTLEQKNISTSMNS